MQIVINIPYGHYLSIKDGYLKDCIKATTEAIVNGTILPKVHGRLIDAEEINDAIYECFEGIQFYDGTGYDIYLDSKECIDKIPTIIEADKAESDDDHMTADELAELFTKNERTRRIRNVRRRDRSITRVDK